MGMSGGIEKRTTPTERTPRRTWFDIMNEVRDRRKKNMEDISNNGRIAEVGSMDDEGEDRKQHNVNQEEIVNVHPHEISSAPNEMELTNYPSDPSYLYPSHKEELDLNNPPPGTAITLYNLENLHNASLSQTPYYSYKGMETLPHTLKATYHPYWKSDFNVALPYLPNIRSLVTPTKKLPIP